METSLWFLLDFHNKVSCTITSVLMWKTGCVIRHDQCKSYLDQNPRARLCNIVYFLFIQLLTLLISDISLDALNIIQFAKYRQKYFQVTNQIYMYTFSIYCSARWFQIWVITTPVFSEHDRWTLTMSIMESVRSKFSYIIGGICVIIGIVMAETWILSLDFQTRGRILRAQFVVFLQLALVGGDYLVWRSLALFFDGSPNNRLPKLWRLLLFVYMCLVHLSYLCNVLFVRTEPILFSIVCYLCLAVHFQFVFIIIVFKIYEALYKTVKSRSFHGKRMYFIAFVCTILITALGFINSQKPPVIKNVSVPIKNLPQKLDGFHIAMLSDIHLGVTVGKSKLDRIVAMVNSLNPGKFLYTYIKYMIIFMHVDNWVYVLKA